MIVILRRNFDEERLAELRAGLEMMGLTLHISEGRKHTLIGLVGDTSVVDIDRLRACDIVEDVRRVQEPYICAGRRLHAEDTVIPIGESAIGGAGFTAIAGPCSIESEEQICGIAAEVKRAGAAMLRGGAFKPRTSPYAFQGLRERGLELLLSAKRATGLPVVSEITDISQLELFSEVDVIQVGARNMQNFELLRELGRSDKPVLLKRGLASTLDELLMSAEYILAGGNGRVILCERGIRTFETHTRNTLDLSAVPLLKRMTHLPVIVDPSHATGMAALVKPMALAATAAGADGLMIEVHAEPAHALSDGAQALTPDAFEDLMNGVRAILPHACRNISPSN